ncbi:DUF4142 domain-containing protein [Azohydromonas lata]|uniref:DUF4142 domain-containing protein n=2 Tax=Azohydromonas lata TaxID=45677 RepID=A0ABU5IHF2_9BURK|nr:DUF4142 domain-containing protein [Azohydromonas lata]MDZ5458578.1 DUF4142 domain-containing protein [Azohydromonas lata]
MGVQAQPAPAAPSVPSDAQIAAIVVAANQVDIDAGQLAAGRARAEPVKAFARLMVADHGSVNGQATALAGRLHLTPADNPTSASLRQGGQDNLQRLRALQGDAFDRAYVDHEVAYHEQVLQALDGSLIPGARNAELRALLEKVRPAFVAHLEHARALQAQLGRRGG